MELRKAFFILVILSVSVGIFLSLIDTAYATGISPGVLVNRRLLPGSYYEEEISLVRSNWSTDQQVKITIAVPEIGDWFSIDRGLSFLFPEGQQQIWIKVGINVPADAQVGRYKGEIAFVVSPLEKSKKGGSIAIALGGILDIDVAVQERHFASLKVYTSTMPDVKEDEPIKVPYRVDNIGNIAGRLSKVHLDVYKNFTGEKGSLEELVGSADDTDLEVVDPFSQKETYADFLVTLDKGSYWASVQFYDGEEMIKDSVLKFHVDAPIVGEESSEVGEGMPRSYMYIGGIILLLLIAGFLAWPKIEPILRKKNLVNNKKTKNKKNLLTKRKK